MNYSRRRLKAAWRSIFGLPASAKEIARELQDEDDPAKRAPLARELTETREREQRRREAVRAARQRERGW